MNIQIFGRSKRFETKRAERYFKERGIRFRSINLGEREISRREFARVKQVVNGLENMIDQASKDRDLLALIRYAAQEDREEKVFENRKVLRAPIVRDTSQVTVGYYPEIWKTWEQGIYLGIGCI